MQEENNVSNEFVKMTTRQIHQILPVIIENKIPLKRKKKDGSYSFIPPAEFDNYLKQQDMVFYVDKSVLASRKMAIQKSLAVKTAASDIPEEVQVDETFSAILKDADQMDLKERILAIMQNNKAMNTYIAEEKKLGPRLFKELGDIFAQALCINKATLVENMQSPVREDYLLNLVKGTNTLVDNLLILLENGKVSYPELSNLEHIQTGSNTLNHINRLLFRFISFMFFFNNYFKDYSNEIKKMRAYFKEWYYPYYDKVVRGSQKISLEIIFKGGISPVVEKSQFLEYTMGSFMHDIGKLPTIAYHDGNGGYDMKQASRHVFDGYNMLLESKEFTKGVVSAGLLHHDYYQAPYGYRQLETFKKKFVEKRKQPRETSPTKFFISYNINDVGFGNTFSFFPNKILEILDVYDAMTDTEKKYRARGLEPEEALAKIKEEFIDGERLGIDPIFFNIFVDFMQSSKIITNPVTIDNYKINKKAGK